MAVFDNWQNTKSSIKARSISIFNNDLLSDVSFIVRASSDESDAKKRKMAIPAHKLVLSICSPVFFAMFCGKMAEKSDTIDLPDCEYEGVLEMLRYLYSEEVKLNESNVMQVLYVAKKYILSSLGDECIDFLKRNLDPANVFCVLSHAQRYDEKSLVDQCWKMIDRKTKEVLKSEGFLIIERLLLEATVKRDTLSVTEVELFKAVDLWAAKECEREGLTADGNVKRRILGEEIVKCIRFPVMDEKEFATVVLGSKILNNLEMKDLLENFKGESTTAVGFSNEKRIGTCQSCCRFRSFTSWSDDVCLEDWVYDDEDIVHHAIVFRVDEDVMLHGIRLLGCTNSIGYILSMKIIDCQNMKKLFALEKKSFPSVPLPYKGDKINGFDVLFDPFVLRKNIKYVVKAEINGPECCSGNDGVSRVQCNGVTFHFKTCRSRRYYNDTSVMSGQFADFFFKPL